MKEKKNYEKPVTALTRVRLENPICGGSVDMKAETPTGKGTSTEVHQVNSDFGNMNNFEGGNWD